MSSMTFAEALQRAQTAFRMGEYTLARRLLEKLREEESDNPVICNLLGSIYERQGEYEKAIGLFQKVIQTLGDNVEAYNNLGVAHKSKGDADKALAAFMKVVKLDPRRADVYYNLGNLYKDLNDAGNAAGFYRKAIDNDPGYILAYNNLGTVLEKAGRHEEALQVYHQGLQIDSKNARLHYNAGVIYKNKNRLKEAEAEFRLALRHQSGFLAAKNNLALVLQGRREYERARELFNEILRVDPANAEAHNNLGVILAEEHIIDGAREHYEAALRINPGYRKARFNLALLQAKAGSPEQALRELDRLLDEDPGNAEALAQAGLLLLEKGRLDEAEGHFRKILDREPDNPDALRAVGRIHLKRDRIGPALKVRDHILKLDRDNLDFNIDLSFYFREKGEYARAEEEIRRFLARHRRHPQSSVLLADILLAQKKYTAAEKVLFDVLETGKREPEILLMLAKIYKEKGLQEDALALLNEIIAAQGASDVIGEVKSLSETIKLYEETVTEYEMRFRDQWEKNLKMYKASYAAPARDIIPSGDAILFEKPQAPADDTVPIINIGGLEPVFEIREEEEELKIEERNEIIESAPEKPEKIVEIEGQGAPSLLSLLDGEPLYNESPQRARERRAPRYAGGKRRKHEEPVEDEGYFPEEGGAGSPPPRRHVEEPMHTAPQTSAPPPGDGAEALDRLAGSMRESMESLGRAMKDSILSNSLLAGQTTRAPIPPPVIMFTQPPFSVADQAKETVSDRMLPDKPELQGQMEEQSSDNEPYSGETPIALEGPMPDQEFAAALSPAEEPTEVEAPAGETSGLDRETESEAEPGNEEAIVLEEAPEELGDEIREGEAAEEIEAGETTRAKLRSFLGGVRANLEEMPERRRRSYENVSASGKILYLSDYLANLHDYLPLEPRFQFLVNEMRVRLETLRGRLSGKPGLFQRIENEFPSQAPEEYGGLTSEKLVSTFSFMRNLSEFMPDPELSVLLRRKIDGILGKMRGVSVK